MKGVTAVLKINFPHILGILLIITGLIFIFSADVSVKNNRNRTETETAQEIEIAPPEKTLNTKTFSLAVTGGLCLIVSVPCFYAPYSEYSLRLFRRRRRKDDTAEQIEQAETEFDYPDDDFDYVLDKETRKILIQFRDEQRDKHNKKFH